MIVLSNVVSQFAVGSVSEDSFKELWSVDPESKCPYQHHHIISGWDRKHIYIPANWIQGRSLVVKPHAYVIVQENEPEEINRGQ